MGDWLRRNLKAWFLAPTCRGCRDAVRLQEKFRPKPLPGGELTANDTN